MENKKNSHLMGGLVIALISIVFGLILYFTNNMQNKALGMLSYLILIVGICIVCVQYSKEKNGDVTFGNLFGKPGKPNWVEIIPSFIKP